MPSRRIRQAHEVWRVHIVVDITRIESVEEIRHADAERHSFSASEWNGNFLFQPDIRHDVCGDVLSVVTAGNPVDIVYRRIWKPGPCLEGERAAYVFRQWKVAPAYKSMRRIPVDR